MVGTEKRSRQNGQGSRRTDGQWNRPAGPGGRSQGKPAAERRNADGGDRRQPPKRDNLKTIAFDSVGVRKYALQVQKAYNGNPCLRIVEGYPKDDGTYRKFDLTIWSEDFDAFFSAMDEIRQFIKINGIRTPEGHKWEPRRK